jgi:chemotaxis protein histidine kinase CheA
MEQPANGMNTQQQEQMFGGGDDMFGGGLYQDFLNNNEATKGGAFKAADNFDNFLKKREDMMQGGVRKTRKGEGEGENVEVREGYDSFTVVRTSAGNSGGRFISKTPYSAAKKAANRLVKGNGTTVTFVLQKTTAGSNKRYYAYTASSRKLSPPMKIFRKAENGDTIVMNNFGQVLRVNKSGVVVNVSGARAPLYNADYKLASPLKIEEFDYTPYLIKEVTKEITVKSDTVPSDLQEERKAAMKAKKKGAKTQEQKEKEAEKKALKKAKEAEKKALKKAKEAAKKALQKEKAEAKKEKEAAKKALKKEKEAAKKEREAAKKEKAKKAEKKAEKKSPKKAKKSPKGSPKKAKKSPKGSPKKAKRGAKKMTGGGLTCGVSSCA